MSDKINLLLKSSKEYLGILLIGMLFIFIGIILIFIGIRFDIFFLIIFGGVFICFSLFFLIYTIPSSISYHYNKALVKKYGKYADAHIIEKEIIDNSYYDSNKYSITTNKKDMLIKEFNYLFKFSFEYQNRKFENSDFIDKKQFKKLNIGDLIPIKFLTINPNKSSIRIAKLKKLNNN